METRPRLNEAVGIPRSRRALLAGVVGGLGAWLASAAQRAMPAEAAVGDPIRIGQVTSGGGSSTEVRARTTQSVLRTVQVGGGTGIRVESTTGTAVKGMAGSRGTGVLGHSPNHIGVLATTDTGVSINARAFGTNSIALFGDARGTNALAVLALGPSHLDGDVTILGRLFVTDPVTFGPTSAPQSPSSGHVRLYARDNGWGKTQLCVQFANGKVQLLATEP
jgi:hypothetical protein